MAFQEKADRCSIRLHFLQWVRIWRRYHCHGRCVEESGVESDQGAKSHYLLVLAVVTGG